MDLTEKKFTAEDENGQIDDSSAKTKGKRLRIKDTRKVDYNRTTTSSRPYQPLFGQTKQSPFFQSQSNSVQDDGDRQSRQHETGDIWKEDKRYHSEEAGGFQRSTFKPYDQGGYQQRNYGNQGGYQQRKPYDNNQAGMYQQHRGYDSNQGSGYQQRRNHDNNPDTGYQQKRNYLNQGVNKSGGGYQQRNYNQNSGYNQGGGYNQNRGYNQGGGYNQGRGYNKTGGYNRTGGYSQGNYNQGESNNQNAGHSQGGGYQQRGGYSQGGFQQRKPGGGHNLRKPAQGGRNQPYKPVFPRPIKYQEVVADISAPIRLNKYLANAGVCSRREADEFIQAGVVKVNGEVITELGSKITRMDKVTFHDQPVQIESKIYILLNKPKNCVTTSDDPQNRQTVMDLVKNACQERIYPVGRLDRSTTGVLLLTNDGEMAAKLTHPSYKKKKIYHVWLDREVTVEDMEKLANGIELEDGEIHADAISYANDEDKSQVGIEIHSGKNRIVRRMFEVLEYHVVKLDRVYFAGLTKRNLGRGKWRYLSESEVNALRMGSYE